MGPRFPNAGKRTATRWRLTDAPFAVMSRGWYPFKRLRDPLKCDHETVRYNIESGTGTCVHCDGEVYDSEEIVQRTFILDQGVGGGGW